MNTHHFPAAPFCAAWASRWRCPGWNRWASGATSLADRQASQAPVRLAVLFSGNGFHSREWWAKGEGKDMELGKVLAPLTDFREKMLVHPRPLQRQALKGNIHSSQTGNLLSGAPLASGGEIRSGTSIDQLVAQRYGRSTKVPSLVLGCEKSNPSVHKNYSMLYSSHISWSSPTTPTPLELYPSLAFDRLFKDERRQGRQERARRRAGRRQQICAARSAHRPAQARRISRLGPRRRAADRPGGQARQSSQGWRPTLDKPNIPRPPDGIPQNIADHMRLMCDILVLGFQTDTTRDLHAQAEQRPLVAAVPAPERGLHDPPSACRTPTRPTG